MRYILTLFIFITPGLSYAQNSVDEQSLVNNTLKALFEALSDLSFEQVKKNTTADFMVLENGEIWNLDTMASKINQLKPLKPVRINAIKFLRTEIHNNTAWVAYENRADITINGQKTIKEWLESAFLVKQVGEWKVSMLHSTPLTSKKN
jgi:hypothetical protein